MTHRSSVAATAAGRLERPPTGQADERAHVRSHQLDPDHPVHVRLRRHHLRAPGLRQLHAGAVQARHVLQRRAPSHVHAAELAALRHRPGAGRRPHLPQRHRHVHLQLAGRGRAARGQGHDHGGDYRPGHGLAGRRAGAAGQVQAGGPRVVPAHARGGRLLGVHRPLLHIWDPHYMLLCVPGVLGGIVLLLVSQRCENSFALPAAILLMPLLFFLVLALCGVSLDEAREFGWVSPASDPAGFVQMFDLFDFSQMHWNQVPKQLTTWLGMTFVVAFSSCLDVAAIEMDMGSQLNINHELKSVGWSNFVSGLLGGYTGSYIFSQTIFTYRSKTTSRLVGVCVIISEFAIVLIPLSVMSLVPRFFFAATLIFIAIDLMVEWLVHVYHKILPREYVVLWLSFIAINMVSLELGMVLGIGFAIINFLFGYAQVRVVNRRSRSSAAVRKLAARTLLGQKRDAIVYLELYGYLFFGSSVQILEDVQKAVHIRKPRAALKQKSKRKVDIDPQFVDDSGIPLTPVSKRDVPIECLDGSPAPHPDGLPTEYVVMDFTRVSGMDATAARSAFMILQQHCKRHEITVIFADVLPEIRSLLLKNEIAEEENFFLNAESALEFCENQLLVNTHHAQELTNHHESMSVLLHRFMGEPDDSPLFRGVDQFFRKYEVPAGYEFYRVASYPDRFYFLASGRVALFMNDDGSVAPGKSMTLLENVMPGAMFGEVDFFGRQYRYMAATALESCTVFEMTRETYETMDELAPALWNRLRDVVMQSMALSITNTTSINTLNNANGNLPTVA
ncbi:hypothetical protein ON010_g2102 [Phytophthora cinnamomi]|nr:hypothetical protein ON010_g2102 [Phytophthora cinnamomi]